jgi:SAM-dependent methyltransferase
MPELDHARRAQPASGESPERFDPDVASGKLIHAEHVARYFWAAQVAAGRNVLDAGCGTGLGSEILANATPARLMAIDIAHDAVSQTTARLGDRAHVTTADARHLPCSDDSFDLIVCFDLIEHMSEGHHALSEFARVLRSDGLLLISSPNPRVYPAGNPHHVHEYVPEELREALGHHFLHVSLGAQQAWIGSLVSDDDGRAAMVATPCPAVSPLHARRDDEREPTYVLAAAGHRCARLPPARLVFGDRFEIRWWQEQVAAAGAEALQAATDSQREAREALDRVADGARQQACLLSRAQDAEQQLHLLRSFSLILSRITRDCLLRTGVTKVDWYARFTRRKNCGAAQGADGVIHDLQDSVSWRVTTPLRRANQAARRVRPLGT